MRRSRSGVGQGRCAKSQVGEFMGQREHLRRFRIRSVDEDQRRERIGKRKAPELVRIETAMVVAHDDPADHDKHTRRFGLPNEQP